MKNPVLVIVDMQRGFYTSKKERTILECQALIKKFIRRKYPIVVLEYVKYGKTLSELTDLLKGYDKVIRMRKRDNDGSRGILKRFPKRGDHEFVICGVNIGFCVKETAEGLVHKGCKVLVIKKACNGWGNYATTGWGSYIRHSNLKKVDYLP